MPCFFAAVSSLSLNESPGRISPATGNGRMRTSPTVPRLATANLRIQIPAADQSLRATLAAGGRKFVQVFGTIYVERNSRQIQHHARQTGCLRRRQMRQKTIVAEAQGEQVSRR